MSFNNKVVLITGAGSGIGFGCSLYFANQKALLALVDINANSLEVTANKIKEIGVQSEPLLILANIDTDSERIINETIKKFGRLDVLINNAGVVKFAPFGNITAEDYHKVMITNVQGGFFLTQHAISHLIQTKGNIVNVSSMAGTLPYPNISVYCMSKAAVSQFTRCTALELAPKGVRVNAVCPGAINTNMFRTFDKEKTDEITKQHPIGRIGEPEEIARAIAFLADEKSSFITGVTLPVDGGIQLGSANM